MLGNKGDLGTRQPREILQVLIKSGDDVQSSVEQCVNGAQKSKEEMK